MDKTHFSIAHSILITVLIVILLNATSPVLVVGSFVLLLAKGISMFISPLRDVNSNENEKIEKAAFLSGIGGKLFPALFAIAFTMTVLYFFFLRKEVWLPFFS